MSVWIDRKYLGMVSSRLERFKERRTDLYNFRCPYCGDSQKKKTKARGYVYRKGNDLFFKCHNCGFGTTLARFLKHLDGTLFDQYCFERWKSGDDGNANYPKPDIKKKFRFEAPKFSKPGLLERLLDRVDLLPSDHLAKQYLRDRMVPEDKFSRVYYIDDTSKFGQLSDKYKEKMTSTEPRIVFPFFDRRGKLFGFSARSLTGAGVRYVKIKISEGIAAFGMYEIDLNSPIYITEGAIDSLFLPNAMAVSGSSLPSIVQLIPKSKCALIWDNEPRNSTIVKLIKNAIGNGFSVCIWPDDFPGNDINDMVLMGKDPKELLETIQANTFSGLRATARLNYWKRC